MAWYKLQQKADTANAVLRTNRRVTSVFKRSSHAHLANTMSLSDILDYAYFTSSPLWQSLLDDASVELQCKILLANISNPYTNPRLKY